MYCVPVMCAEIIIQGIKVIKTRKGGVGIPQQH